VDVPELALAIEDFLAPFAGDAEVLGESAEQLDDLRDVVVVFAVFRTGLRVEEVVAGDEFEGLLVISLTISDSSPYTKTYHSSHAPHIRASTPLRAQNHLRRAVLSCLNVVCEMMAHPTRVTQIRNLHRYLLDTIALLYLFGLNVRCLAEIHV